MRTHRRAAGGLGVLLSADEDFFNKLYRCISYVLNILLFLKPSPLLGSGFIPLYTESKLYRTDTLCQTEHRATE